MTIYTFRSLDSHEPVKITREPKFDSSIPTFDFKEKNIEVQENNPKSFSAKVSNNKSDFPSRLENSKDYRVLFESLLNDKSDYSGSYASHILKTCARIRRITFSEPSNSTRQDVARQLMADRCSTFTDDEISDMRRKTLLESPIMKNRVEEIRNSWFTSGLDIEKKKSALKSIIELNDPLLLEYVGPTVLYRHELGKFAFAGEEYDLQYSQLISNIFNAAICEATSTPCGPINQMVVEACALNATCASSRLELVQAQSKEYYGDEGLSIFKKLYPQMVQALKNNDVSTFLK